MMPRAHATYADVAFEPQADFAFDDAEHGQYETMQRNITSLNMFNTTHARRHDFELMQDPSGGSVSHVHCDPLDGSMYFGHGSGVAPAATTWPKAPSPRAFSQQNLHSDILNARASSVTQHFGQITPPDDTPPKEFPAAAGQQTDAKSVVNAPLSAKSERARNAANQRHAKAKKARKDSAKDSTSASVEGEEGAGEEGDGKREKYREKNRVAAAKCRAKKKTHTEDLEESARHITATNNRLRAEERELRDLFSSLRHQALAHDPTQGCNCSAIHMYNHNKAQEAARTAAMGLVGMGGPAQGLSSPSIGSEVSGMNSPRFASQPNSRAPSFSTGASAFATRSHQPRAQSTNGHFGFLPPRTASDMRRQSQMVHGVASPNGSGEDMTN